MGKVLALDALLESRQIWRGLPAPHAPSKQPTGLAALDDALPGGGWPDHALTELLLSADGVGELRLLWPTLARLSRADGMVVLIAPPYLPFAGAWAQAGVQLNRLQVIRADTRHALWAAEQCLRSAACSAVLCWPPQADDRALRRLQVAAETGQCLGFAMRPMKTAANPSPAALRIAVDAEPAQLRVLKCRGGNPPTRPIALPAPLSGSGRSPLAMGYDHAIPTSTAPRREPTPSNAIPFRSRILPTQAQ
ncbi:MAG: translesion DNA synthesis-associated protein ImuA [Lysobacter sp.]